MSTLKPAIDTLLAAIVAQNRKRHLLERAELSVAVIMCFGTALGFITLGLFLWLCAAINPVAASFILAFGLIIVGLLLQVLRRYLAAAGKKPRHDVDPTVMVLGVLSGLLDDR